MASAFRKFYLVSDFGRHLVPPVWGERPEPSYLPEKPLWGSVGWELGFPPTELAGVHGAPSEARRAVRSGRGFRCNCEPRKLCKTENGKQRAVTHLEYLRKKVFCSSNLAFYLELIARKEITSWQ